MRYLVAALSILGLLVVGAVAGTPRKGPYLIYPGDPSRMTIVWQLRSAEDCSVAWGEDGAFSSGVVHAELVEDGGIYSATLSGLAPSTTYQYQVRWGEESCEGRFMSAPSADADATYFLGWADTQCVNWQEWPGFHDDTAEMMLEWIEQYPEYETMVVHAGDWVNNPLEQEWTYFFRPQAVRELLSSLPMQGCIGNHDLEPQRSFLRRLDTYTEFSRYWRYPYVEKHYWSFDYGPIHFTILDVYTTDMLEPNGEPDLGQRDWAIEDIGSTDRRWKVLLLHNPPCALSGPYGSDDFCEEDDRLVSEYLLPILEAGVDLILCGHAHTHYEYDLAGTPVLVMNAASECHEGEDHSFYAFDVTWDEWTVHHLTRDATLGVFRIEKAE